MIKKENSFWINGVKLFACICVFLDHFDILFYYCSQNAISFSPAYSLFHSACNMFLNVYFYLGVFYILSGVLAQNREITTLKQLAKCVLLRYIRFAVPLFFASMYVYLVSKFPGFYHFEASEVLNNDYISSLFPETITVEQILRCTFLFDSTINPILWTIGCIFWGTEIIYVLNYMTHSLSKGLRLVIYIVFTILLFLLTGGDDVNLYAVASTVSGAALYLLWDLIEDAKINGKIADVLSITALVVLNSLYSKISSILMKYIPVVNGDKYYMILAVDFVIAFIFVFFMKYSRVMKKVFSAKPFVSLSKISFTLYMTHEPLICSLSLMLYVRWFNPEKYYILIPSIFVITVLALSCVIFIYHSTFDRLSDYILMKCRKAVNIAFEKV